MEHFCATILKSGHWPRTRCRLKFFYFSALAAILFNKAEPLQPSWTFDQHNFSLFRSRSQQVLAQSHPRFEKRCQKFDFQDGGCGRHLGFSIGSFSNFVSHKRPNAHHQVSIQLDYRGDVQNMNSQHFSYIKVLVQH